MAKVKKIVRFLKEETPQQAVKRLRQSGCRFCTIAEIYEYWQESLKKCNQCPPLVCLHEDSFFGDELAFIGVNKKRFLDNMLKISFCHLTFDSRESCGILVEVEE